MEKLICNAPWGKAKTSRFAWFVALVRKVATSATLPAVLALAMTALGDGLPAGYTQVPYIQANGNCQIRTGITPTCTDKAEMQFRPAVVNATQNLWCSRTGSGTTAQFTAFLVNTAKLRFDRGDGGANVGQITSTGTLLASTNYLVVADYATLEGVVTNVADNTEVVRVTMPSGDYTPASELCLFASHTTDLDTGLGNYGSYALYSFKLRDSAGTLKLDLVPAKRDADGVIGLYDLARSTFLTNSQSGFFTTIHDERHDDHAVRPRMGQGADGCERHRHRRRFRRDMVGRAHGL